MTNLQDLPVEILKNILAHFIPCRDALWETWESAIEKKDDTEDDESGEEDSPGDLYKLCLVSKKLRDVAQPYLFLKFADEGMLENMEDTIRFVRCLYSNPELGQFVQELSISPPIPLDGSEIDDEEPFNPLTNEDIELLGKEHKAWVPALKKFDLSVLAALIVEKTPNLRRLILPGGVLRMEHFSELMRQNPAILGRLERVAFLGDDEHGGYDIASYQEFLTIPTLKFVFFQHGDLQSNTFPSTWEPEKLAVQDLIFHNCQIDGVSVKRLARACKALKIFIFDDFMGDMGGPFLQRDRDTYKGSQFNAADLHEALLGHKDTLKYLRLELPRSKSELDDWQRFMSSRIKMGPLSDFSVLEDIHLQQAIVSVQPKLSPAVKRLNIVDCNSSVVNLVKNIAKECKKGTYPELTRFYMFTEDLTAPIQLPGQIIPAGKSPAQAHEDLVDLFKGTSVDFFIRPFRIPDPTELPMEVDPGDSDYDDYDDDDIAYDSEGYIIDDPFADALRAARGGGGGPGGNGPMPPELLDLFMRRAMQDPDFAPLHSTIRSHLSTGRSRRPPWATEDDE